MNKRELYFSGMPAQQDPKKPLPGEVPPGLKRKFVRLGIAIGLLGAGVLIGVSLSPETPVQAQDRIQELEQLLGARNAKIAELNRSLSYKGASNSISEGVLRPIDRLRHEKTGKFYANQIRRVGAQPAAELVEWFIGRWNTLLDNPLPEDRITRRAHTLALLVGGMARNVDPEDYVPWQAEFLAPKVQWLGEVHFDIDGDGLPGKRSGRNRLDSFTGESVCHVAMALNQAIVDAQILVMPQMRCDSPKAKISIFLQGTTWDDALNSLVKNLRADGFLVVEKKQKNVRLILIGPGKRRG